MKMNKLGLVLISLLILIIGIGCLNAANLDDACNGALDDRASNWYPIIAGTLGGGISNGLGSSNPNSESESLEVVNPDEPLQLNDKPASTISGALDGDYSVRLGGDKAASSLDIDIDPSNPYFDFPPYNPLNPFINDPTNPNDVLLQ